MMGIGLYVYSTSINILDCKEINVWLSVISITTFIMVLSLILYYITEYTVFMVLSSSIAIFQFGWLIYGSTLLLKPSYEVMHATCYSSSQGNNLIKFSRILIISLWSFIGIVPVLLCCFVALTLSFGNKNIKHLVKIAFLIKK